MRNQNTKINELTELLKQETSNLNQVKLDLWKKDEEVKQLKAQLEEAIIKADHANQLREQNEGMVRFLNQKLYNESSVPASILTGNQKKPTSSNTSEILSLPTNSNTKLMGTTKEFISTDNHDFMVPYTNFTKHTGGLQEKTQLINEIGQDTGFDNTFINSSIPKFSTTNPFIKSTTPATLTQGNLISKKYGGASNSIPNNGFNISGMSTKYNQTPADEDEKPRPKPFF